MAINAAEVKGAAPKRVQQPNLEIGGHPARVVQVVDLGVQARPPYKGQPKDPIQQLWVTYELSDDFMLDEDGNEEEDRPRWVSERFPLHNLKADKATSTKRYNAIDPKKEKGGDWGEVVGDPCTVVIVHNDKDGITYDNVGDVTGPPRIRGYKQPELVNDPVTFDLDNPDLEVFQSLPEFLQEIIKGNLNYQGSPLQALLEGEQAPQEQADQPDNEDDQEPEDDDDVPF